MIEVTNLSSTHESNQFNPYPPLSGGDRKKIMKIETLNEIELELKRFNNRLDEAKKRLSKDEYAKYGCKETAALRRAALDLKNELTAITSPKY